MKKLILLIGSMASLICHGQYLRVPIDYTKPLAITLKEGGYHSNTFSAYGAFPEYSSVTFNDSLACYFLLPGEKDQKKNILKVRIFDFKEAVGKTLPIAAIAQEMTKSGCRPATLMELLAFGANYRDLPKRYPIIASGAAVYRRNGQAMLPCISIEEGGRIIQAINVSGGCDKEYSYLGVVL